MDDASTSSVTVVRPSCSASERSFPMAQYPSRSLLRLANEPHKPAAMFVRYAFPGIRQSRSIIFIPPTSEENPATNLPSAKLAGYLRPLATAVIVRINPVSRIGPRALVSPLTFSHNSDNIAPAAVTASGRSHR